jgi:hypothetical protein
MRSQKKKKKQSASDKEVVQPKDEMRYVCCTHLNKFNTITNQLSYVENEFDNKIHELILFPLLLNSRKVMRMVVRNSTIKSKLKYNDICGLIMA